MINEVSLLVSDPEQTLDGGTLMQRERSGIRIVSNKWRLGRSNRFDAFRGEIVYIVGPKMLERYNIVGFETDMVLFPSVVDCWVRRKCSAHSIRPKPLEEE
jgi:hypothetical protein